jgi:hypothetical protein
VAEDKAHAEQLLKALGAVIYEPAPSDFPWTVEKLIAALCRYEMGTPVSSLPTNVSLWRASCTLRRNKNLARPNGRQLSPNKHPFGFS